MTKNKVYAGITAFCAAFILIFGVLFGMNISAESMARKNATFSTMEKAVKMDVFEWEDYALSYVMASISTDVDMEQAQKADEYAQRLSVVKSNTIHLNLTAYYLTIGDVNSAMNSALSHMRYCASSSEDWNEIFEILMSASGMYGHYPEFSDGVFELVSMMKAWDDANIGNITLSESVQLFAARYE